jgi:hypothetical protein
MHGQPLLADPEGVIRVRRSYTDGEVKRPKNHEIRGVHLSPDVVELLGNVVGRARAAGG